jgi:flagellar basal body rod protein FlgF
MLRVGTAEPYQLVIDKEGNFGVGSVTLNNNVIANANFKVDSSGNTTIGGTADKPNFKIDNTGDLYVGPNGNLFNLKITKDGNLYISPSGTDANGKDAY